MLTVQVYVEATIAFALMVTIGIIRGAGVTGDRAFSFGAGLVMLAVSGAVLVARLWRMTRKPLLLPVGEQQAKGTA